MTVNEKQGKKLKKQKLRNSEYYNMQDVFDRLHAQATEGRKFNSLLDIISSEDNILLAYRNIKKNDGSKTKGTDGQSTITKSGQKKNLSIIFKTNLPTITLKASAGLKFQKRVNLTKPAL